MSVPAASVPAAPAGSATLAPFIMSDDAEGLIAFLVEVFGAVEVPQARTQDVDGLVLHSELLVGDSLLTVADRKPHWPYTPAFVRVYVDDVEATLERAVARGARIVTEPTDVWGDVFSRFADPYGHLWWVYKHNPTTLWDEPAGEEVWTEEVDLSWEAFATPELTYLQATLLEAMDTLHDPRTQK
ncbi:Glyoxalase/bleomycin resistance protein/dioxygenase [Xylanimonas cellulosilytica DSM 15894]|uniref:Glyoxalase/bleomycin resistance protein/dioxygenase n=1 Tax=Xylanimonas cellulosilytica (strain DSM 15894 / JCM 12276 / CECT 5975 / KCTC 9989 / LMG 20990 / NBRC 107835 / XIL07) TaxID=446471 RepID=D1BRQ2_XYLCX|nr:VOC family protein [Xylanimonas cellulosilytica]ACZ32318.1 Glyoxalase/bleomycin resistance protein/dioxygenase [Xylanimonas cellulosilytica DSM 15894]